MKIQKIITKKINDKNVRCYVTRRNGKAQLVCVYYKIDGKRKQITKLTDIPYKSRMSSKDKDSLQEILDAWAEETYDKQVKKDGTLAEQVGAAYSFYAYMDTWNTNRKPHLSPTTYNNYKNIIDKRIKPFFNNYKGKTLTLCDVTSDVCEEYFNHLRHDYHDKEVTLRHHYVLLNTCFRDAIIKKKISQNPLMGVEKPKEGPFEPKIYKPEEIQVLLTEVQGTRLYAPVVLAAYYGLRRSEIIGLRWSNVDFEQGVIRIAEKAYEDGGKTLEHIKFSNVMKSKRSIRTLPIIEDSRDILLGIREQQLKNRELYRKSYCNDYLDYVCVNDLGVLITPHQLSESFVNLLEGCNLPRIRLHDLRHSVATMLVNNSDVKMIQIRDWLGHSTITMTERYAHLDASQNAVAASAIDTIMHSISDPAKDTHEDYETDDDEKNFLKMRNS